jgi:hypothetical protein
MLALTGALSVAAPPPHAACEDVLIGDPAAWASRPLAIETEAGEHRRSSLDRGMALVAAPRIGILGG